MDDLLKIINFVFLNYRGQYPPLLTVGSASQSLSPQYVATGTCMLLIS